MLQMIPKPPVETRQKPIGMAPPRRVSTQYGCVFKDLISSGLFIAPQLHSPIITSRRQPLIIQTQRHR